MTGTNLLPLEILEFISSHGGHPTVSEIGDALNLPRNTAYRAIGELEREGWVKVSGRPKRVIASFRAAALGGGIVRRDRVRNALFPNAVDVAVQTGWICNISYYEDGDCIHTDAIECFAERLFAFPSSSRFPAMLTAGGKILLAHQPTEEIHRVLDRETPKFTERSKTDRSEILAELELTRERGYSYVEGELREDIVGIGVAVFDSSGNAVGCLSSGVTAPVPVDYLDRALPVLRKSAERASLELGYVGYMGSRRSLGQPL